jgi:hypothetical protein
VAFATAPPGVVRIGQTVLVSGRARHVPRTATAILQVRRGTGWSALAQARVGRSGSFAIRWSIPAGTPLGPVTLRLAVRRRARLLATSLPAQSAVGSAYVPCAAPTPPAMPLPAGDGWIVGGLYEEGGPFPGFDRCSPTPYTITATDSAGTVQATQSVAAGDGYWLDVPAGTYTLTSGPCRGQATVTAGRQTTADTLCAFP